MNSKEGPVFVGSLRHQRSLMSRRSLLQSVLAGSAGYLAFRLVFDGKTPKADLEALQGVLRGETSEQKDAENLLLTLGRDDKIFNLTVVGEYVNGKRIANLRNRPNSLDTIGIKLGYLAKGDKIDEAVVVEGNNPAWASDPRKTSKWLAFRDPRNSKVIVFSPTYLYDAVDINKHEAVKLGKSVG